ncbi:MAG: helix-turn-helix domain-containing protein [Pseudomonadota bacterium]
MAQLTPSSFLLCAGLPDRLARIGQARQALLYSTGQPGALAGGALGVDSWIERSWQRCLARGHRPEHAPSFEIIATPTQQRTREANRLLVQAARPVLEKLGRAIANTRYFAILTNQHGVVVDAGGAIDRSDPRADLITRIGTDLSEHQLATTAISAALTELQPVWLHRGEHFFEANTVYSCAGAPLFGPDGHCVGMLDLTGIETPERPELKHLVIQSARSIENALTLMCLNDKQGLLLRLNWPGRAVGNEGDGLICVDGDGFVLGANQTARQMLPHLNPLAAPDDSRHTSHLHCSELFATAFETLFDAARNGSQGFEVPLWSGLRLQALPQMAGEHTVSQIQTARPQQAHAPLALKDLEAALIRKAVNEARGNVMQAARALGISRATVYRRLGKGKT